MPTELKPPTERIPAKAWARTPKVVRVEMVALVQELADVKARLAKAEEHLRRTSHNSSQPVGPQNYIRDKRIIGICRPNHGLIDII
jgi:hypothetical protein